jgi:hypothetical protein
MARRIHGHQNRRHAVESILGHVGLGVLLQMVAATEFLAAGGATVGTDSSVDSLVAGELFVAGKGLAAVGFVTLERSFACKKRGGNLAFCPILKRF